MKILLIKNNQIYTYNLPKKIKDNFWITDLDNFDNQRNLVNIVAENGKWILYSNYETHIVSSDKNYESVPLTLYNFYTIKNDNENSYYYLYCAPLIDNEINRYQVLGNGSFTIGKAKNNHIIFGNMLVEDVHAQLTYNNGIWSIIDNKTRFGTFVNDKRIYGQMTLENGDVIFIAGLKIVLINNLVLINNINKNVVVYSTLLAPKIKEEVQLDRSLLKEEELDRNLYEKEDYFYRSPRFIEDVVNEIVVIEDPPAKILKEENSLIMSIGPMFTMAITSFTTAITTVTNVMNGDTTWKKATPSLIMAGAMLCSMLVWPLLNRILERKKKKKKEEQRVSKYGEYIEEKKKEIQLIVNKQTQTLKNKYIDLNECYNIIYRKRKNLWERGINQNDFLTLRLGIGNMPIVADIRYSKEKFVLEEDALKQLVYPVVNENNMLIDVPLTFSLTEKYITSIIGKDNLNYEFFKGLLLQMITFHSYEFLKIVVLTNKENESRWNYLHNLPYLFDNNHQFRFFATDIDETKEISLYLEKIYQDRKLHNNFDYKTANEYYVIVTDNYHSYRDIEIIKDVLNQDTNYGFSLVIFSERIQNLPSECHNFISVEKEKSGMFESEITIGHQKEFTTEFVDNNLLKDSINRISNIPIDIATEDKQLPSTISFLEMYNVGKIEQLNIANRWSVNNSKKSLAVPVGIEKSGTLLKLDLHEKYHGPHGLIAGMTGSGKSEFIITYILSLAVNYSPDDVAFILIDYKGGGLAGAFENRETGVKLPHLAGTITNLDTAEMNRSLASIQSELRRRQQLFNEARDSLGESTVDIYKYQSFYKEGKVKEPIPHLMIISDEFAELKSQQPEFMGELISTARIGRSLGVHLILATQKPSGVVNDQIWSNSRFRVCLKVQEKSDSNEMIKCPDAAFIKNVGRFYLQVGYNELFAFGQSAWCGAQYYPKEKLKKKIDQSLVVIDKIGNVINTQEDENNKQEEVSMGEELNNVLKHIIEVSKNLNIKAKPLWLSKISPEIYVENVETMFEYKENKFVLNPLIGMYDDPNNQYQGLVTMPLSSDGNSLIYGSSGSGKELLLTTMIYSLITWHTPQEVNLYIVDFGAGTLKMFEKAPHVGDVILSSQEEKIKNLFKAMFGEINKRKKLFANYNGDYQSYIKNSGKTLPYTIIVINNYDSFIDAYDYNEEINQISRECDKYGIILIFTLNSTSSLRYKTKQNFKSNITLQFNDNDDYSVVLGNVRKLYPANIYGRGLVKIDNVYEFQTAYVTESDNIQDFVSNKCVELKKKYPKGAMPIPVVPEVVDVYDYISKSTAIKKVPLGISHDSIDLEYFDFLSYYSILLSANESELMINFIEALITLLSNINNCDLYVLDGNKELNVDSNDKVTYLDNNFDEILEKLAYDIDLQYNLYIENNHDNSVLSSYSKVVVLISNFDKFITKIGSDNKKKFEDLITKGKELETFIFILSDTATNLKKYEYDSWYKSSITNTSGIWIGNGVTEQSIIKVNVPFKNNLKEIGNENGVVVKNSKPSLVKLVKKGVESI